VLDVGGGLPEVIVATTGGASTRYVQVQGQVLAQEEAGAWAYVLPDHLGSVRQLADTDGQVTRAQSFDPFGVLLEANGSGVSEFGYTGEQADGSTGLVFLRARYYGPSVGRFTSKDPFRGFVTRPQSLGGYSYVENRPLAWIDPNGYFPPPPERTTSSGPENSLAEEIVEVVRSGWSFKANLHPGGFYGAGMISFGSSFIDIWVEPRVFLPSVSNPRVGSYTNTGIDILYETVIWIQGVTNLEGAISSGLARMAIANSPPDNNLGGTLLQMGTPATLDEYRDLHIGINGYAWYGGGTGHIDPLSASDPATLGYARLIDDRTPKYPGGSNQRVVRHYFDDPYSVEGPRTSGGRLATGTAYLAELAVEMAGTGDVGLRKYQVQVQRQRASACTLPGFDELFTETRAIIQTYHLYRNAAGYQINPAYLSVHSLGSQFQEVPIYYPGVATLSDASSLCNSLSSCYNRAELVEPPEWWMIVEAPEWWR
jgi:RHS repeat-associated protein